MIYARIDIHHPLYRAESFALVVSLHAEYGGTADTAHRTLTLALTAASHPVVVDADGGIHRIPREFLRTITTWDTALDWTTR